MYTYNVTVKIEPSICAEWKQWMQTEHIPEVLATGLFTSANFKKLMEPFDEDGETYVAQYHTDSIGKYNNYIEIYAPKLRDKGFAKFGNKFIAFRSLVQEIESF